MSCKDRPPKKSIYSVDTLAFTESLGLQTFRKEQRKTWMKDDDEQLLQRLAELYPQEFESNTLKASTVNWEIVSHAFNGARKAKDCRKRWALSLDPNLRRGKWTPAEDALLVQQFEKFGALWQQVALAIAGRTEHQCLKRYYEVLDPSVCNRLKHWTEAEDLLLIDLVTRHGTKWKTIAAAFEGRPSLTCRNRWRNVVTAVVRGRASASVVDKIMGSFDGNLESLAKGTLPGRVKAEPEPEPRLAGSGGLQVGFQASRLPDISTGPTGRGVAAADGGLPLLETLAMSPQPRKQPWQEALARPGRASMSPTPQPPQGPPPASGEWKYSLAGGANVPENDPVRALLAFGGTIQLEQLANYLVQCASQFGLQVNVHHHHPPTATGAATQATSSGGMDNAGARDLDPIVPGVPLELGPGDTMPGPAGADLPGFAHLHLEITGLPYFHADMAPSPAPRVFSGEPESQISRFQHFNYLPPLTPVPRLHSSASSPEASSRGSTQHHHHYYHNGQYTTSRQPPPHPDQPAEHNLLAERDSSAERDSAKESDLFRLLNQAEFRPSPPGENSRAHSMTPLSQAVQIAAATDPAFYKRTAEDAGPDSKRRHVHTQPGNAQTLELGHVLVPEPVRAGAVAGAEPGPDLAFYGLAAQAPFHTKRRLQKLHDPDSLAAGQQEAAQVAQAVQPVSQHHPLHYFTSNNTAPPEDYLDEEDEDFLSNWGMYSMRDKPQEPLEISEDSNVWFPFNPS